VANVGTTSVARDPDAFLSGCYTSLRCGMRVGNEGSATGPHSTQRAEPTPAGCGMSAAQVKSKASIPTGSSVLIYSRKPDPKLVNLPLLLGPHPSQKKVTGPTLQMVSLLGAGHIPAAHS
jgi:hypothetical protein